MKLMEYLPIYYRGCEPVEALQEAAQEQAARARESRDGFLAQCVLQTATWGLSLWEQAYGLEPEAAKTPQERRARVMGRMRGAATTTPAHLEEVAGSFANRGVEVQEIPKEYRFLLRFFGLEESPVPLASLRGAIEECKPAHLAWLLENILERPLAPARLGLGGICAGVSVTRLGPLTWEYQAEPTLGAAGRNENITQTVLPHLGEEEETAR